MLLALTTGQKLVLAGVAAVFIVFALAAAMLIPRTRPDFPGPRGVRWFVLACLALFVAMMLTVILVKEDEAEGHGGETAVVHEEAEQGEEAEGAEEESEGDPDAGADVFAEAGCGGCHTFSAANATGTTGPNLDRSGADFEAVRAQIAKGGGGMPAFEDQLEDEQIDDVAAYVVERRGG